MTSIQSAATAVAVATSTVPGEFLVPDLIAAFAADHPEFTVESTTTDSAGVFAALRSGDAEVGFAGVEPDGADLVAEAVATDEIVLVAPAGHALAGRSTVTVEQLGGLALVEREEGSGTRRSFTDALADRGTPLVSAEWTVRDSNEGVLAAVADGAGLGVVSARVVEAHGESHGLVALRVAGMPVERALHLVLRDDAVLGAAATTFVAQARAAAADA